MRTRLCFLLLVLLAALPGIQAGNRNTYPLPEERGTAGVLAALGKLPIYVRVLQTTAHPDDESAGTLTWLSRKFHAHTALFCLTRGEGGQNILGDEKYEELGLLRTGELLEATKYYGIQLFFGTVLDFGFSKTAEETLAKWGHEATLEEMVRFIRRWHPDIVLSRFQGNSADGHGHHQAAGILTREAFSAASDPHRFPQQLDSGLQIWKPKKLYVSSMGGGFPPGGEGSAPWTVRVPVGDYDPVLGRSYREIGSEGYSKHRSQGDGATAAMPGRAYEYFRLVESSVGIKPREESFFEGIDPTLLSIYDLAGDEKGSVPFLRDDLNTILQSASGALSAYEVAHPEKSAAAIVRGIQAIDNSISKIQKSSLSREAKKALLNALHEKLGDFQEAMNAVLGIYLIARTSEPTAVPGEKEPLNLYFYNQGQETVSISGIKVSTRQKGSSVFFPKDSAEGRQLLGGGSAVSTMSLDLSPDAEITKPFWSLANRTEARYTIRPTQDEFAPFENPELTMEVRYRFEGTEIPISAVGMGGAGDPIRGADFVDFQVLPALTVILNPGFIIAPVDAGQKAQEFQVSLLNNRNSGARGKLKLLAPDGWDIDPSEVPFELSHKGETFTSKFRLQIPASARQGNYTIQAVAETERSEFREGSRVLSYPENWTRYFYFPARSMVERFDVKIANGLTIGYIPGAGDDIPEALDQLGIKVQILSASDLAFSDLHRFTAIVTGIRAYNVNEDLRANNRRLLEYVAQGGTLIVQYVRPMGRSVRGSAGLPFSYGPYPMSVSDADRITVEDSPIKILEPANPLFSRPNKITEADFQGWIQERGLYFMNTWDSHYLPLLSGNDPGEEPKTGGMLYASYGKGHYIYTGYAWFRQLPAGVPGAFRIFANMLSLGQSKTE
jgi:LmbE family N-acetylglucosaminyl deacetylase